MFLIILEISRKFQLIFTRVVAIPYFGVLDIVVLVWYFVVLQGVLHVSYCILIDLFPAVLLLISNLFGSSNYDVILSIL